MRTQNQRKGSDNTGVSRNQTRWHYQRSQTSLSLFLSLVLHTTIIFLVAVYRPAFQRPKPSQDLLTAIEVDFYRPRFHATIPKPRMAPRQRRNPAEEQRKKLVSPMQATKVKQLPKVLSGETPKTQIQPDQKLMHLQTETRLASADDSPFGGDASSLEASIQTPNQISNTPIGVQRPQLERRFAQSQPTVPTEQTATSESKLSRSEQIGQAMVKIAQSVADSQSDRPTDIVFLLDKSGSMKDNILAVSEHLKDMVSVFQSNQVDFTMGVVTFTYQALIFDQTKDHQRFERLLNNVDCGGLERPFNAIVKSVDQVKFRPESNRRFILVTDEPLQDKNRFEIQDLPAVLRHCLNNSVVVDVIGLNEKYSKYLAQQTRGLWFPVPN
ncbi:MAG: vWA domain-containing protein [Candidatus Poribacteria bacterium]|nr:vWA domain-containing protein [Candidatus Poribacteria bacterium]MDP6748037.1 vWA domain-containing protein [Candidatus Poribacteria bacterium]MDP6960544.1 vWA domain-containing protein [Dehalococcoidia bacterium]